LVGIIRILNDDFAYLLLNRGLTRTHQIQNILKKLVIDDFVVSVVTFHLDAFERHESVLTDGSSFKKSSRLVTSEPILEVSGGELSLCGGCKAETGAKHPVAFITFRRS